MEYVLDILLERDPIFSQEWLKDGVWSLDHQHQSLLEFLVPAVMELGGT